MSEQLANLYSTTLAAPYVAGSLAITVTSATGAPGSGTFTLTILDAGTGDVILLFRVTSVAGPVFTGAAEGPDTNAASASIVVGTILSAAAITQLFADHPGGGGFIQPTTPPVFGNFSNLNFNVGTSVVTTRDDNTSPADAITLQQTDPGHTGNTAAIQKAPINAAFTITLGLSLMSTPGAGGLLGLWLSDGGSNGIIFGTYNQTEWFIIAITSLTNSGGGASSVYNVAASLTTGPLLWLRVQETASARNYYLSADGVRFILILTESNTAHFTTADYGIGGFMFNSGGSAQVVLYSFTETTP